MTEIKEFTRIRTWASERGLYAKGDVKTQFVKLSEEFGEVAKAIINSDDKELKDGIGDMVVVLTNLAHIAGTSIEQCIELAWEEIKNRKGSMQNGSFVKEATGENAEYECIGNSETICSNWKDNFVIGNKYKTKKPLVEIRGGVLALLDENKIEWYVDSSQFKLINK